MIIAGEAGTVTVGGTARREEDKMEYYVGSHGVGMGNTPQHNPGQGCHGDDKPNYTTKQDATWLCTHMGRHEQCHKCDSPLLPFLSSPQVIVLQRIPL